MDLFRSSWRCSAMAWLMAASAMALFVLGFGEAFGDLVDARNDEQGLLLDEERLPRRVRIKKSPNSL